MKKTRAKKLKMADYFEKEYKIPIRVVLKPKPAPLFLAPVVLRFTFSAFRKSLIFGVIILSIASQSAIFNAFEAHVINVTATIEDGIAEYIVINEVYYDVGNRKFCAVDEEEEPRNEWIELYNPTDAAVDISGWIIEDNDSFDVIPSSPQIPSHGFAVIAKDATTWQFWTIPPDAVKIELGSLIGNGLNNDGDRVILKDVSGAEIDAVSYGTDTYAFTPSAPDVPEGWSIARSPKGFDTNRASDWVGLETPNPGTNPHYKGHNDGTPCSGGGAAETEIEGEIEAISDGETATTTEEIIVIENPEYAATTTEEIINPEISEIPEQIATTTEEIINVEIPEQTATSTEVIVEDEEAEETTKEWIKEDLIDDEKISSEKPSLEEPEGDIDGEE